MLSAFRRFLTLPRLAAAVLSSGVLLTILAVTAMAGDAPDPAPPLVPEVPTFVAKAVRPLPDAQALVPPGLLEGIPAVTVATAVPREDEGAIEAPSEEAVEAARADPSGINRFSMPLAAWDRVTDRFGAPRGYGLIHGGIDLAVGGHVPILGACTGTVLEATYSGSYGNYVYVDCGDGWTTLYGHLSSLTVEAGDSVDSGTGLGYSGSTGYSTGEHLHFEIRHFGVHVNPEHYLDFKIPPGTPLSDGPIVFPRNPRDAQPGASPGDPAPTPEPPTATPTVTNTPTPTATPTVTNTPTPTPTVTPRPPTPTPTPRPVLR
jgi:murein DD-endopeptidase MepM/ murein hydrolase activator NlpD